MIKYDSDHIIVGYIKQILSSFNFPDIDILKDDTLNRALPGNHYIVGNKVKWCYAQGKLKDDFNYKFNTPIFNLTYKFDNKSLIYDYNTHLYLGKYLKYLRDYKGLDLMSLYNCFSDSLCDSLYLKNTDSFGDIDLNYYKVYSIPVDLFETYSIYLGCTSRVEMVCSFGELKDTDIEGEIKKLTQLNLSNSQFNTPIIFDKLNWDKLKDSSHLQKMYRNKDKLRLLVKLPINNKSSIVILNGVYNHFNDYTIKNNKMIYNRSINNYDGEDLNTNLISPISLIKMNTGVNHPFSDRLIEYLSENAITPLDKIPDNFKRLYASLMDRYNDVTDGNHNKLGVKLNASQYGLWQPKMRNCLYDIEVNGREQYFDILGYCDKDVEKELGGDPDIYGTEGENRL